MKSKSITQLSYSITCGTICYRRLILPLVPMICVDAPAEQAKNRTELEILRDTLWEYSPKLSSFLSMKTLSQNSGKIVSRENSLYRSRWWYWWQRIKREEDDCTWWEPSPTTAHWVVRPRELPVGINIFYRIYWLTRLGYFYVTAILSWGNGCRWVEAEVEIRLRWDWVEV